MPSCRLAPHVSFRTKALEACAWTAMLLMPYAGQAQEVDGAPLDADAVESVEVDVVNVEVYVTDGQGRTVDGLTADDFRLFVDHRPTEISNFYRADPLGAAAAEPEAETPLGTGTRDPLPDVSRDRWRQNHDPLTLVIYVDHLQLTPNGRRSYLEQLREFLDGRLVAGDNLMVVSHSQGLQVEERFTGDFGRIAETLDSLWQAPAGALEYGRQYQNSLDQIENILLTTTRERPDVESEPSPGGGGTVVASAVGTGLNEFSDPCSRVDKMLTVARNYGDWVASQVSRSLDDLERLVKALGGIEGRKAVLYLSNGLDQTPGLDLQYQVADLCPTRTFQTVGTELSTRLIDDTYQLASLANSRRVTFYNLDASRLDGTASTGIERAPTLEVNGRQFDLRPSAAVDARRREGRQATLATLALETGGLAVLNANEIDLDLGRIEDSLRRYYSLGFTPEARTPGATHLLRVELEPPRGGHTLHYRRTYVDQEAADETQSYLLSALLLGHQRNPLGVDLQVGPAGGGQSAGQGAEQSGGMVVPVRIAIPLGALGWLQRDGYRDGKVELMVAVHDEVGGIAMRNKTIPFRLKEDLWPQARDRHHVIELALPVPSADARLAFAMADRVGGQTSFLSAGSGL